MEETMLPETVCKTTEALPFPRRRGNANDKIHVCFLHISHTGRNLRHKCHCGHMWSCVG